MRIWTEQDRRRQSDLIRARKPWLKSTGPRTVAGKARSSRNAFKHGHRSRLIKDVATTLRKVRRFADAARALMGARRRAGYDNHRIFHLRTNKPCALTAAFLLAKIARPTNINGFRIRNVERPLP